MKESLCSILLLLMLCAQSLSGQTVRVLDRETMEPVHLVVIVSDDENNGAITDEMGQADISHIDRSALLLFRHPSYRSVSLTFAELVEMNYVVTLQVSVRQMDEVVVSASKWEQHPDEIPQQIVQISPEQLSLANPATTADALATSGQVFVQKSQLGGGSPIIRGFAANSVLIVIDGLRMNNAIYRSGNLQNVITLDANALQEAEVVFGPGSVIYGSDALGGVMDFHTKTLRFTDAKQISGSVLTRFGSAAHELTGNFQLNYTSPGFTSFSSLSFSDFGDLRSGSKRPHKFPDFGKRLEYVERVENADIVTNNSNVNRQVNSGYDQTNFLQKFHWQLTPFSDISYNAHLSTSSDIPRYDRLIQRDENGDLAYGDWYYGPQKWQMHQFLMRFFYPTRLFDQVKVSTAYQLMEESRNSRRLNSDMLTTREEKVDVLSVNVDFEKSLSETDELYYGVELVGNRVTSSAFTQNLTTNDQSPASTRYPDGGSNWGSLAVYFGSKQALGDHFFLNSGLRYTYISLESIFEDQSFFNFPFDRITLQNGALSGSLGLVYLPNQEWKMNVLMSSGFRSPNIDDVGKVFDSEPGNVVVPNPDLKPETSYNLEYGVEKKFGKSSKVSFVNYFSFLRNALVRRNFTFNGQSQIFYEGELSQVQAEVNAGKAFIWGASVNAQVDLGKGMEFQSSITYTDGEDTIENLPLRHVTPLFGQSSLSIKRNKLQSQFLIRYSGGIAFEDLAPSEQSKTHLYTPDGALPWYTLSLNSAYAFNEQFTIGLNLENILDQHYRTYSSGISAPGFNVILSLRASF